MDLVVAVYKITGSFPVEEKYGLVSQIRRSAVSIPSNIAEGAGRRSDKEYLQFLNYALGSASELDTQLILAKRLNYGETDEILNSLQIIQSKLIKLIQYLKSLKA